MKTLCSLFVVSLFLVSPLAAQQEDWAKERLEKSPRHLEWIKLKHGNREVKSLIVFPEVKEKATAVIVIHEIFGLGPWVQGVADQLAEAGYIAIAPDLLSGMGPKGGGTEEFGQNEVRKAVSGLSDDQVTADLNAAYDYVKKLPAGNGKVVVAGFCWGGRQTFRYATNNDGIQAALVFYGNGPTEESAIAKIKCPVYGFYGENDARVNMTIKQSEELMKAAGKTYEPVIYKGAGHGFMRAGEMPDPQAANKQAREDGWVRVKKILKDL
ncbi:MAG: dienelactone hydrolase family protein [Planctomycetales bacterium]